MSVIFRLDPSAAQKKFLIPPVDIFRNQLEKNNTNINDRGISIFAVIAEELAEPLVDQILTLKAINTKIERIIITFKQNSSYNVAPRSLIIKAFKYHVLDLILRSVPQVSFRKHSSIEQIWDHVGNQ